MPSLTQRVPASSFFSEPIDRALAPPYVTQALQSLSVIPAAQRTPPFPELVNQGQALPCVLQQLPPLSLLPTTPHACLLLESFKRGEVFNSWMKLFHSRCFHLQTLVEFADQEHNIFRNMQDISVKTLGR